MESKTARLTILVDPAKKRAFERLCAALDLTPSQVVRQLIREYLTAHGVTWETRSAVPPAGRAKTRARRSARRPRRV
ncbi:MAG: ribbon-helix-helix domain-containing protein [Burkholderiales bacterium]|nr:ribbon-helix-helix domain-containing protein [Burkholderiales bacterium]